MDRSITSIMFRQRKRAAPSVMLWRHLLMLANTLSKVIRNVISKLHRPKFDPAWLGQVGPFRHHHPVFSAFIPFSGPVPVDFEVDFIGMRTRREFMRVIPNYGCSVPAVDEDYFEWIDVLQSVRDARNKYTMIELGACYGPWAVRAALAARQLGIEHIQSRSRRGGTHASEVAQTDTCRTTAFAPKRRRSMIARFPTRMARSTSTLACRTTSGPTPRAVGMDKPSANPTKRRPILP